MIKSKFTAQLLVATLALSGIIISSAEVQAKSNKPGSNGLESGESGMPSVKQLSANQQTTFYCGSAGNHFATFAKRGAQRTGPMIIWKSAAFGPGLTPEARCKQVSNRFTTAVKNNGGNMRNLLLTTGRVNGRMVVCFVNTAEYCNSENILFTLKPENANNAGDILANLLHFSRRARSIPVFESAGGNEENPVSEGKPQHISLEEVVNKAFDRGNSDDNSDVANPSVTNPNNTPGFKPE